MDKDLLPTDEDAVAAHLAIVRSAGLATDDEMDVAAVGLALAALDLPGRDLAPYAAHIRELCDATSESCSNADYIDSRADSLTQVISHRYGYTGDLENYNDMQNANLMQVIERRKGLPVALGLLYIIAARAQGWACAGLNFPGHFLIRLELGNARCILDPFHGGVKMEIPQLRGLLKGVAGDDAELKPEYYQPISNRIVLLRLLNNIKGRAIQNNDFARTTEILFRMRMLSPDSAHICYEQAMAQAQLGNIPDALEAIRACLDLATDPKLRQFAEQALSKLRLKLN